MPPDERCREVDSILADGLCRLRDRAALEASPRPENPSEALETSLEDVPVNRVIDEAG